MDKVTLAMAIAGALLTSECLQALEAVLGEEVHIHHHEGEDTYIDFEVGGKGWRLDVNGPFDIVG